MRPGSIRVAVFSELPTPYRWPVFARLLEHPELDPRIFFCSRTEADREWDFEFRPDSRVRFLPGRTFTWAGRRTIHYHVNPTVFRELRRGRYDVVVLPGYSMFVSHAGALWCRLRGVPYVIFSETTLLAPRRSVVRLLKRALLPTVIRGASAWLATGRLSREYLVEYGADPDRIFRFPNTPDSVALGAEADRRRDRRDEIRRLRDSEGEPVVLFVGRLIGVKRCDLLLSAAARLKEEGREPYVWVAGDGPLRRRLMAQAKRDGLCRVRFLGNMPSRDLPAIYAAADVFVLPSDHEPWGAVSCEAAACGVPLVLSDRVGAGADLVEDGETGEVFRHGDARDLALCLKRVLSDPERRRRMGLSSRRRARAFTHRECVEEWVRAVRTACGAGWAQ